MESSLSLFVVAVLAFLSVALAIDGLTTWWRANRSASARRVRARIERINSSVGADPLEVIDSVVRVRPLSAYAPLNALLERLPGIDRLDDLLSQSKVSLDAGKFLALSLASAFVALILALVFLPGNEFALMLAPLSAVIPWVVIQRRKERLLKRFNEQLPDALDAMSRALKAGYSVVGAMKFVGEEMPAPLGPEFSQVHDEIAFGIAPSVAFKALTERIASEDLRFMVIAILIQRETGGNLGEILSKISGLMRQRRKFSELVKTLSADGRMTAWVLCLLPVVISGIMLISNRAYIETLWVTGSGRTLLLICAAMMSVGILWIRKQIVVRF